MANIIFIHFLFSIVSAAPLARSECGHSIKQLSQNSERFVTENHHLLRVHNIGGIQFHEILEERVFSLGPKFYTKTWRRRVIEGPPPPGRPLGRTWHFNQIYPALKFGNLTMGKRRGKVRQRLQTEKPWPSSFIDKLFEFGNEYLENSMYAVVYEVSTDRVVGCQRFIFAPATVKDEALHPYGNLIKKFYGLSSMTFRPPGVIDPENILPRPPDRVPESRYLGIDLIDDGIPGSDPNTQELLNIEVGTYAIDNDLSPEDHTVVWEGLWSHWKDLAFEDEDNFVNYYGKVFHGYANETSKNLYSRMGAEPLLRFYREGILYEYSSPEEVQAIEKDEIQWTPVVLYPDNVKYLDEHIFREGPSSFAKFSRARKAYFFKGNALSPKRTDLDYYLGQLLSDREKNVAAAIEVLAAQLAVPAVHRSAIVSSPNFKYRGIRALFAFSRSLPPAFSLEAQVLAMINSSDHLQRLRAIQVFAEMLSKGGKNSVIELQTQIESILVFMIATAEPAEIEAFEISLECLSRFYSPKDLLKLFLPETESAELSIEAAELRLNSLSGLTRSRVRRTIEAFSELFKLQQDDVEARKVVIDKISKLLMGITWRNSQMIKDFMLLSVSAPRL